MKLTNNIPFTADDSTPDAPMPDEGTRSSEDQDDAATSSDSESSFSDWHLSAVHATRTASCKGHPSLFWAPVVLHSDREVGCSAPVKGYQRKGAIVSAWSRRIQAEWL